MVIAESANEAKDAAEQVVVDYGSLPAVAYFAFGLDPDSWVGGFCIPF